MQEFVFPALMVSLFSAFVVPFAVNFFKENVPNEQLRYLIALGLSIVTGLVGVAWTGQWNLTNLGAFFGLCVIASQSAYNLWFHALISARRRK